MKSLVRRPAVGLVLFGALGAALALTRPVSTQGRGWRGNATVIVNGAEAIAGEALVKFDRALDEVHRQRLDIQIDADQDEEVGGIGVRRMRSRFFDTETLLTFLRTEPGVAYAEPTP